MAYLVGPLFGLKWGFLKKNLGIPIPFDNTRSRQNLGVQYTPVDKTLIDHAEQLIRDKLVRSR